MNKEVNIIRIVRQLRYLKLAMRQILPKNVIDTAKKRSRYMMWNDCDGKVEFSFRESEGIE